MSPPRVAFVNGGILGVRAHAAWVRRAFTDGADVDAEQFVLTEDVPFVERAVRRALCARVFPDLPGWRNIDLARYRSELNAGFQARRRLLARGVDRFDVLHFHHQATAYASLDLMERIPAIVSIDCTQSCVLQDASTARERWALGFNVRRDGEIFRRATTIVSTSQWAARELGRMYPACAAPIHVLQTPVLLDAFDPAWAGERRERGNGCVRFLFMGGDFPRKGGYDLLDAWVEGEFASKAALTIVTDWHIGRPVPPGVLITSRIRALTPEWASVWHSADVFVMPTRSEAFGNVYQEAAAAGLPSIGSRLNAIPELIADGKTGVLVAPGDRRQLIRAMEAMLTSADMRNRMGQEARQKVSVEANPDVYRRKLVALITQTAGCDGRTRR
jgi:glycosyltransferase involved in cell wall biosynthesis